ncbi:MAG: hypothetical protein Q8L52_03110 [bacterium]|nr:hypothetical protein [bacterium]
MRHVSEEEKISEQSNPERARDKDKSFYERSCFVVLAIMLKEIFVKNYNKIWIEKS